LRTAKWSPPLSAAAFDGDLELVQLLLARGARWDVGSRAVPHALMAAVRDDRLYEALLAAGAPPGFREVVEAVDLKDLAALRAALVGGRWAEDASRLARAAQWKEGADVADQARRAR